MVESGIKENLKSLKGFIIKRFIVLLCFIALEERIVYFLFTYLLFPFLEKFFAQNKIEFQYTKDGMIMGVALYLLFMLLQCIIDIMPSSFGIPLQYLFRRLLETLHINEGILVMNDNIPPNLYFWIRVLIIVIIIVLLAISIAPYVISIVIYTRSVSRKVEEHERKLEKMRSLMLADIAHDLRTPLTSITGYSQALLDNIEDSEEKKRQYMETIHKKAVKLDEMVYLFFEYTKLDSEGFKLKKERENLAEILREAVAELFMDFEEKGIHLEVEIPETPVYYFVDRIQISRAITNLLVNALRHNEPGNTVYVQLLLDDDIEIIVADNGKQIPDDIAKNIFEPFAMGDKSRNSKNGSGLGLSIAATIAAMHKGNLELDRNSTELYTKAFIIHI